jgi:predicted XRE-type DNA-binding protein
MNPHAPEPTAGRTALNAEQWERLRRKDSDEWLQLLAEVMPVARSLIDERFGLLQLHGGDSLAAMGAVWSAWPSFQRHFLEDGFASAWTVEDLAVQLVRVTHNRMQRERRKQDRLRSATDRGAVPNPAGLPMLAAVPNENGGPGESVSIAEFLAKLRNAVDDLCEQIETPRKRDAVALWLSAVTKDERASQTKIAEQLGINQSTVSRWLEEFKADVRRMLGSTD